MQLPGDSVSSLDDAAYLRNIEPCYKADQVLKMHGYALERSRDQEKHPAPLDASLTVREFIYPKSRASLIPALCQSGNG